jgi:hypothetical protein
MRSFMMVSCALALVACEKKDATPAPEGKTPASKAAASKAPASKAPASKAPASKAPASKAPAALAPLEIKAEGFAAVMQAPAGATAKDRDGTREISAEGGKSFFVWIDTDAPDMGKVKDGINKNDVQKVQSFHLDTPEAFIYETKAFGKTSFWMDSAIKVGDKTVHCYSGRGAHSYTKAQVEGFLAACKSLKAK